VHFEYLRSKIEFFERKSNWFDTKASPNSSINFCNQEI